jgi:pimeloyl-ACP methyl ester carboxylesterase
LPGYGLSDQPTELGWDPGRTARAWAELMSRLGYSRYVAQGGDQGASVTDAMARQAQDGLLGIHLNLLTAFPTEVGAALFGGLLPAGLFKRVAIALLAHRAEKKEPETLAAVAGLFRRGYFVEMPEHPQTIGYALTDTPIGMAAWMLDHDADSYEKISRAFLDGQPVGGLTRDRVLDNMTLYWLTNTATSSARLYWEQFRVIFGAIASGEQPPELSVPVAFTVFPGEIFQAPRSWAEKVYPNLIYFNEVDRGGHFAAWEEPELFATELRAAFKSLR